MSFLPLKSVSLAMILLAGTVLGQSNDIAPGENLVLEGVPKIPASVGDAVGRYTEYRLASFASWHPTQREMLIVTRFGDTYQVHDVRFPGGARTQLTFYPDNVFSGIVYEPVHGESFIFAKDVGGNEFYQIYRYDLAGGKITLLTDGKSRNTGPRWSYAGDRIVYGSTRRNGKDVDIWIEEPFHPESSRLLCELDGGGWSVTDWSSDGTKLLLHNAISAAESYVW